MANLRRLPGVVFWHRYRALSLCLLGALLVYVVNQSGMVCSSNDVLTAVEQLVSLFSNTCTFVNMLLNV